MFATLPMYDWPEIRDETDALWRAISERLGVDVELDRTLTHEQSWQRRDLTFSQTCGYPLTHNFKGLLTYVATPHYDVEGCEGPLYSSSIFARPGHASPTSKLRAAINSDDSMSGMLALKLAGPAIDEEVVSGSHVRSLEMLQSGEADVCAIDAVCVALARRHRPWLLKGLAEIARSPLVPGLPFVTRSGAPVLLRGVLKDVFEDATLSDVREALLLNGISDLGVSAYQRIIELECSLKR